MSLTFMLAQAERIRPRIAYFDKDRGAGPFIRAIGGRYDVLRPGEPTGFNPLLLPDEPGNRAFLAEWLAQLLSADGSSLSADDRAVIADAIHATFPQATSHRPLRFKPGAFPRRPLSTFDAPDP